MSGSTQVKTAETLVAVAVPELKISTNNPTDSPPSAKPSSSSPAGEKLWLLYISIGREGVSAGYI